jgi:hypothetical protein
LPASTSLLQTEDIDQIKIFELIKIIGKNGINVIGKKWLGLHLHLALGS